MGGLSPERDVSIVTGNSVIAAIKRKGLIVVPIQVDHNIGKTLQSNPIDLAFIALHGTFGEDGCIQGLLEYFKIPYTASGVMGSALAYDKLKSKEILKFHGIPTADYEVFYRNQKICRTLDLPVVVKPTNQGSSLGITIVENESEWEPALETAFAYSEEVIVEKFIAGKLLAIGMNEMEPMPIVHIRPKSGFYDYEAKYTSGKTEYVCPAYRKRNGPMQASRETGIPGVTGKRFPACGCHSGSGRNTPGTGDEYHSRDDPHQPSANGGTEDGPGV